MRVLVCGGAGYIGSNMTAMLARGGHQPLVFDNLSTGHRAAVGTAELIQGDLADYDLLLQTFKSRRIEAVMHFAALIEVRESIEQPLRYYNNNLLATHSLLRAMEAAGVNKLVFSSTAAVYGSPQQIPTPEDSPTVPINPYGETKLAAEHMCHFQSLAGKLRYASLRYFNAAGAGADRVLGEDHRPETHLIAVAIQAALGKRSCVQIFGDDYPTPDGTCIRDYVHVEDLCTAHLLALERLGQQSELVYNLGNNHGYSVKQVLQIVRKVSGKDFKVVASARRPGDPPVLLADAGKAANELNWRPRYTELGDIVQTAWKWHSRHPDGYEE